MRQAIARLRSPLVVWMVVVAAILLAGIVLSRAPEWRLRPLAVESVGWSVPAAWSPDGRLVVRVDGDAFDVIDVGGSRVLARGQGWSPVWVSDHEVLYLEDDDAKTSALIRLNVLSGDQQGHGQRPGGGRLIGHRLGYLAHHEVGSVTTSILDQRTGRVTDRLVGYRPLWWTPDGELVMRQLVPGLENTYPDGGWLVGWRAGRSPRVLAPDLIELHQSAVISPDGHHVACLCLSLDAARGGSVSPDVYRIPLQGSEPSRLLRWRDAGRYQYPVIAWRTTTAVDVLSTSGLDRLLDDGSVRRVLDLEQRDAVFDTSGRLYRLRGAVAVVVGPRPDSSSAQLIVVADDGKVAMSQSLQSMNLPSLLVEASGSIATVFIDPQRRGEPPTSTHVLEIE